MDLKFLAESDFQFRDLVRRAGVILTVPESMVKEEIALGKHKKTENWNSGLLNHCKPICDRSRKLLGVEIEPEEDQDEEERKEQERRAEADKKAKLRKEFEKRGLEYDARWSSKTLENKLMDSGR